MWHIFTYIQDYGILGALQLYGMGTLSLIKETTLYGNFFAR